MNFDMLMKKNGVIFVLLICLQITIFGNANIPKKHYAQSPDLLEIPSHFGNTFQDTFFDFVDYHTSPLRWKESEWGTFWTVIGITGGLILVDHTIFFGVDPDKLTEFNQAIRPIHELGNWSVPGRTLPMIYFGSQLFKDYRLERATRIAIKSFLFQSLVNQTLKNVIYRTKQYDPYEFQFFSHQWELPSTGAIPSGHASNLWAVMSGYALAYKDDPYIPLLCYSLALTGSLALITDRSHWISDIYLGAALGYYSAELIMAMDDARTGYAIVPIFRTDGPALGVTFKFD